MELVPLRPDASRPTDASGSYHFSGTLLDRLCAAAHGDRGEITGITLIDGADKEAFLSYRDLQLQAECRARQLLAFGIPGSCISGPSEVLLPIEDNRNFVILFWACLMAGAIPVPISGAAHDELNLKFLRIWQSLKNPRLVTTETHAQKVLGFLKDNGREIAASLVTLESLYAVEPSSGPLSRPQPQDLAFLQFSSGSTGEPKGVRLTHANLMANIGSTLRGSQATSSDSMLSWMPLSHDMGLIGVHLRSVSAVFNQFLMPTSLFIRRPLLWLDLVHRHRATHLVCPNFGYEYLLSALGERVANPWDLSCIRVISNGAEPISETVARRFCSAMIAYGMSPDVIQACYGLAENTLAVSLSTPGEPLRTWQVTRDSIAMGQTVRLAVPGEESLTLVDCGQVVDTVQVRVSGESGHEVADLQVGRILIAGESTTAGYYNNPEATGRVIRDGWLDTGDLGFRSGGSLVITGRAKELIILNGANFYPYDIERVVETALGLEGGSVAACGCRLHEQSEQLVLFIRHKGSTESFVAVADRACREVASRMGVMVSDVVPVRRIPKTTSGKLQRFRLAETWQDQHLRAGAVTPEPAERLQFKGSLERVIRAAEGLTHAPGLDPDRALADQGIDSLQAVELSRRIGSLFALQLPVSLAFDYPNLRLIANYVDRRRLDTPTECQPREVGPSNSREPIAIIGAGLRLPGGICNLDDFWRLLVEGKDAISEVPANRWAIDAVYDTDPDRAGKMSTRFGAFLNDVEQFDAPFFEISGAEARDLDPQQRILLETTWEALENGGQNVAQLRGTQAGVFVGISNQDYARRHVNSGDLQRIGSYSLTGSSPSAAAGRIAYCFGFEGPAMAVDTACSSSLVAVHLAARSLQAGESAIAVAAGVNLILGPEVHVGFSKLHAMAKDGRCKTFDESADGYVRGEGCVVAVMKRLSDALAAGDPILAVLRGTAVNQDGASNGFTAPNGLAQQAVIRRALDDASVEAASVGYVEAHGTGTALGDPQEMAALVEVYGQSRDKADALRVGSVKTNIGHTEAAAGLTGLLKAVLCVREGLIPPSLHFHKPSPFIPWPDIPVRVPVTVEKWPVKGHPHRAAVSSFGFTGTNAHAVVERAPDRVPVKAVDSPALLLPISAKTPEALAALRVSWIERLSHEDCDASALCQTAALRRAPHRWRMAVSGHDRASLLAALKTAEPPQGPLALGTPKIAFVFPGQGSQWLGMGRELMAHSPVFRRAIEACSEAFRGHLDIEIAVSLAQGDAVCLSRIDYVQPALFAFEVALARVWQAFGIQPHAVIGHSMGEVAAAYIAGALSLDDAARVICRRSALLRRIARQGAMCSADLTLEEARQEISEFNKRVSIAACNAHGSTVLAGDRDSIDAIVTSLEARGVYAKKIKVDVASHSPQVDELRGDLETDLAGIQSNVPRVPLCSTVSGTWCADNRMDTQYWIDNLRQPVMFCQGVEKLLEAGIQVFVELSPHPILVPFIEDGSVRTLTVGSLRRDEREPVELYGALGRLWQAGANLDWNRVFPQPELAVSLPSYPWQRQRYWLDEPQRVSTRAVYPDLGTAIEVGGEKTVLRECEIRLEECAWLEDHQVEGIIVFPAAAFIELAARCATRLMDVRFLAPLPLSQDAPVRLQLRLSGNTFEIRTRERAEGAEWTLHCVGRMGEAVTSTDLDLVAAPGNGKFASGESFYDRLTEAGLQYGPAFRLVKTIRVRDATAEAVVDHPRHTAEQAFCPAFLDACFQTLEAINAGPPHLWIPASVSVISMFGTAGETCTVSSELQGASGNLTVRDHASGKTVFSVQGLKLQAIGRTSETGPSIYSRELRPIEIAACGGERRVALAGPGRWFDIEAVPLENGVTDIVYVAPLDQVETAEDLDVAEITSEVTSLMKFMQSLTTLEGGPPRLRLVMRGEGPTQSALRGFFRSVTREYSEFRPVAIQLYGDAGGTASYKEIELTLADWPDSESEITIRGGDAFVPRIAAAIRVEDKAPLLPDDPICAEIDRLGDMERIAFAPKVRSRPGPGEIEVEVSASGLNFLNVLSAMGLYPGYPNGFRSLGIECSGRVVGCGDGVTEFRAGDQVFGIAEHTVASHVMARAALFAKNKGIDAVDAAALPVAYCTAAWSLRRLARVEAGETVLIHSATGGVGRAAVEIARQCGANIIATAGSEMRRATLRNLGIEHAFDSRSLEFERSVLEATGGRGVDVVLNSLSGDAIEAGLRCLAPFGRFIDIGKSDFYGAGRIALENFRSGISYCAVDLDRLAKERERQLGKLWRELADELAHGVLKTLPIEEYGFSEVNRAFADMAQARHKGKIVLVRRPGEQVTMRRTAAGPKIAADRTYMITGGTGAVGVLVTGWIVEHGGRHVVLVARGEASAEIAEAIEKWNRGGANVRVMQADVADAGSVNRLLSGIERSMPPLAGIVHAAGVLADSSIAKMDATAIQEVFAAKVGGALNLHTLTLDLPLQFFIMVSSAAGILGPAGQANYAAANATLDAIAALRRSRHLPAVAVALGPVAGRGLAANGTSFGELPLLEPEVVAALLFDAANSGFEHPLAMDLRGYRSSEPCFAEVVPLAGKSVLATGTRARIVAIPSRIERLRALEDLLAMLSARLLRCDPVMIDSDVTFKSLGLDSLMAMQLRNRLNDELGVKLSVTSFWKHPSPRQYAEFLDSILQPFVATPTVQSTLLSIAVEDLSEAEAERRLMEKVG